jgi:hypothetical protein
VIEIVGFATTYHRAIKNEVVGVLVAFGCFLISTSKSEIPCHNPRFAPKKRRWEMKNQGSS